MKVFHIVLFHQSQDASRKRFLKKILSFLICLFILTLPAQKTFALDNSIGQKIFTNHCSGCHVNGGNIIRRSKNLKLDTLKRKGIDNSDAIAKIAREGIGIMSGYGDQLEKNDDHIVAIWILEQAQKAWIQG